MTAARLPLLTSMSASLVEAGVDEAGRGCLAGPVVAAAVILPSDISPDDLPGLDDSKKLSEKKRDALRPLIEQKSIAWAVATASPAEIDEINILHSSILAMHRALDSLSLRPQHILVDGNRFKPYADIPFDCIVGGDAKYLAIAAASVIAKTERDKIMTELDKTCPGYGWAKNKGYPTRDHYAALAVLGVSPLHRRSFRLA